MEKPERGEAEEGHRLRKAHPLGPPTGRRYSPTFATYPSINSPLGRGIMGDDSDKYQLR